MAEEINPQTSEQKVQKPKKEKVSLVFTGTGTVTIEEFFLKSGECLEVDSSRAERFLSTGLFQRK